MSKEIIVFREVLLRLSPPNDSKISKSKTFDVHYGGTEANVRASLALMGHNVNLVTALPQNEFDTSAETEMLLYGMKTNIIRKVDRLGIYFEDIASKRLTENLCHGNAKQINQ